MNLSSCLKIIALHQCGRQAALKVKVINLLASIQAWCPALPHFKAGKLHQLSLGDCFPAKSWDRVKTLQRMLRKTNASANTNNQELPFLPSTYGPQSTILSTYTEKQGLLKVE